MDEKRISTLKCAVHALSAFAILSFLWVAFIALGIGDNNNTDISAYAVTLVRADLFVALFSAVYGFSFKLLENQKMSAPARRTVHILLNYVTAMLCVYALFSNVNSVADVKLSTWIVLIFFASMAYFAIYGICVAVGAFVKRRVK